MLTIVLQNISYPIWLTTIWYSHIAGQTNFHQWSARRWYWWMSNISTRWNYEPVGFEVLKFQAFECFIWANYYSSDSYLRSQTLDSCSAIRIIFFMTCNTWDLSCILKVLSYIGQDCCKFSIMSHLPVVLGQGTAGIKKDWNPFFLTHILDVVHIAIWLHIWTVYKCWQSVERLLTEIGMAVSNYKITNGYFNALKFNTSCTKPFITQDGSHKAQDVWHVRTFLRFLAAD